MSCHGPTWQGWWWLQYYRENFCSPNFSAICLCTSASVNSPFFSLDEQNDAHQSISGFSRALYSGFNPPFSLLEMFCPSGNTPEFLMTVLHASGKLVLSFLLPSGCFESLQRVMDFCLFSKFFYSFLLSQKSKSVDPFCAISQSSSPLMMTASLQHLQNLFVPAQTAAGFSLGLGVSCQQTLLSFLDPPLVCNHFQFNERFLILYWILDRPQLPAFNCL